jgi:hypothetical protein
MRQAPQYLEAIVDNLARPHAFDVGDEPDSTGISSVMRVDKSGPGSLRQIPAPV